MSSIDISKMDKAEVLAALYNRSKPLGLGILHFTPELMEVEEARDLLKKSARFDYLKGRVMKVRLDSDSFDPGLYDRDNGEGAAVHALKSIRKES